MLTAFYPVTGRRQAKDGNSISFSSYSPVRFSIPLPVCFGLSFTNRSLICTRSKRSGNQMMTDYQYLHNRIKALQQELEQIRDHNRKYFRRKRHTEIEKIEHRDLHVKVSEIRAELSGLLPRKAA